MPENTLEELAAVARQSNSQPRGTAEHVSRAVTYDAGRTPWTTIGFMVGMGLGLAGMFWSVVAYWIFYFMIKAHAEQLVR